jgi:glycosyltransferase involved in cell wall biosynthesis
VGEGSEVKYKMKRLGIYYATACYRSPDGKYYTSSGLGRYLTAITANFNVDVALAAPVTLEARSHLCFPISRERVHVYDLPYFERFEEARKVRTDLVPRLRSFLQAHRCDLLWLRYPAAYGTVVWQEARRSAVPCFIEIVGDPVAVLKRTKRLHPLKKWIALGVARWHEYEVERIIETTPAVAVSRFLRERYSTNRNLHKILTMPCGSLQEEDFYYRDDTCVTEPYRVLSVARLDHMKSLHTLIDAVSILQKKGVPIRLDIVGSGPERDFLRGRAQQKLLQGSWCLHGGVDDKTLHETYCSSDVFALPSIHEGLGRVYYEAMARGLPVVATWIDGIVDVVLDGVTGILVPPNNPVAIAQAIEAIVNKPSLRRRLIQNGYRNAERFKASDFVQALLGWACESLGVDTTNAKRGGVYAQDT